MAFPLRHLPCFALALLLGGCGLHLASRTPLPPQLKKIYIDYADAYRVDVPPLQAALAERLRRSGADVVASPQQARSILRLSHLTESRETAAIGPDGRALEFRLVTSVTFELASGGKVLLPPETQTASSDYSFNAGQILAKEEEATRLEKYIQGELADMILLRVNARLSHLSHTDRPSVSTPHSPVPASTSSSISGWTHTPQADLHTKVL